ncbi:MAG: hypothetical protein ACLVLR_13765 [Turicibacter sanguinis]
MRKSTMLACIVLCGSMLFGCQTEEEAQQIQQNYVYTESEYLQTVKEALKEVQIMMHEEGTLFTYEITDKGEFLTETSTEPTSHIEITVKTRTSENIIDHYVEAVKNNQTQYFELDFDTLCKLAKLDYDFVSSVLSIYGVEPEEYLLSIYLVDDSGKTVITHDNLAGILLYRSQITDQEKTTYISDITGEEVELD